MRFLLCALALVVAASPARGGVLTIWSASATYWTATDSVEIVLGFSRPPDLSVDYVGFGAWPSVERWPPSNLLSLRNDDGRRDRIDETIEMTHVVYLPTYSMTKMGTVDYTLRGNVMTILLPLDNTGLPSPNFEFSAFAQGETERGGASVDGFSSIDHRVTFIPEPSSCWLSLLSLLAIPGWRRYQRYRRHVE
jgi:hypothetical protein